MRIRIIFLGSGPFAKIILEKLVLNDLFSVVLVITNDKNEVAKVAIDNKIDLEQPQKLKNNQELIEKMTSYRSDIGVLSSYGKIIPEELLSIPKKGILNAHPSLLPKFRGPSPIQSAILAGEEWSGTTIFLMDELVDHGPILKQQKVNIEDKTYVELRNELANASADLINKVIIPYINNDLIPKLQNEGGATQTHKISSEDGIITNKDSVMSVLFKIRALNPEPGTFIKLPYLNIKITKAIKTLITVREAPGIFIENKKLYFCLSDGCIEILELQPENRKTMSNSDFINGYARLLKNSIF